jgi:acetyl/propionyl-CoA carboxylase alpha subunit
MEQVMGTCLDRGIKVVSNAGGLDPDGCAEAVAQVADRLGLSPTIAYVSGDNILGRLEELVAAGVDLAHFETGEAVGDTTARVHAWTPSSIDAEVGGRRTSARVTLTGSRLFVQAVRGTVTLDVVPRFVVPGASATVGGFIAPMPGVVIDVRCQAGDDVTAGQTLIVLEAMKMEHHMNAPADGRVAEVRVVKGQQVENGAVLVVFEESADDGGNP